MIPDALATGIRELLERAAAEGARRALAEAGVGPTLLPLRQCGIPYRAALDAERRGELRILRRGRQSWVDRADVERWIRAAPSAAPEARDEIDEILAAQPTRRRRAP